MTNDSGITDIVGAELRPIGIAALRAHRHLRGVAEGRGRQDSTEACTSRACLTLELDYWPRKGCNGAVVYLDGDEGTDEHVIEIGPAGKTNPEHHMYNEVIYVLSGRGATSVWYDESKKQTFEWAKGAYFSIPMNATGTSTSTAAARSPPAWSPSPTSRS